MSKNPTNLNLTVGMLHSDVLNLRSQYCSDEVYTMFADNIAAAKKVDKALKAKLQAQAAVLANSAVGATVADFPLRQSPAGAASLYGLTAGTTILFFNSDGCIDCSIYKVRLSASIAASSLIKEGHLRIVSVYGSDPAAVESKLATEPADWEVACIDTAAYDQRLRPAVYVLDSDKKIKSVRTIDMYDNGGKQPEGKVVSRKAEMFSSEDFVLVVNGKVVEALSGIKPSDIEKVDVKKDAETMKKYNVEGKLGVMFITTK